MHTWIYSLHLIPQALQRENSIFAQLLTPQNHLMNHDCGNPIVQWLRSTSVG